MKKLVIVLVVGLLFLINGVNALGCGGASGSPCVEIFGCPYCCNANVSDAVCPACYTDPKTDLQIDCGAIKDIDCTGAFACIEETDTCDTDDDCTALKPVCNLATGLCVECLVNGDCDTGEECVSKVCKPIIEECTSSLDCDDGETCDIYAATPTCIPEECSINADCTTTYAGLCETETENSCATGGPFEDGFYYTCTCGDGLCIPGVGINCETGGLDECSLTSCEEGTCSGGAKPVTCTGTDSLGAVCEKSYDVDCIDDAYLPFFGFWNFIITFLVIALIYFFARRK